MIAKPLTLSEVAERWDCSAEKIRRMVHDGELAAFRLGKLIRIPAQEVERYECQATASPDTVASGPLPGASRDALFDARLARMTGVSRKPELVNYGDG